MASFRNMNKIPRVIESLKQMNSQFLSTPEAPSLDCRKIKRVMKNYTGNKPIHQNSILRMQCQPVTNHSWSTLSCCSTASFHHLAENALIAWVTSKKNADFTVLESFNGTRNYAKEVDGKEAPPVVDDKKQAPSPMNVMDFDGDARYAEAKRMLKEKRISKAIEDTKKSPFGDM